MSKILRKLQKVFAASASNNGQFGSAQLGTKVLSNDLDTLQGLAAWGNGWLDAVVSPQTLPTLEEMQATNYVNTSQLKYLFQEGISEFLSTETYYENSIVKKGGTYQLYGSIIDDNTGNALTDNTKWQFLVDLGDVSPIIPLLSAVYPIGSIYENYSDPTNPATLFGFGTWVSLQDRFLVGAGGAYAAGSTGGASTHTLTAGEIPTITSSVGLFGSSSAGTNQYINNTTPGNMTNGTCTGITSNNTGGGAHSILNPYTAVYMWRRAA